MSAFTIPSSAAVVTATSHLPALTALASVPCAPPPTARAVGLPIPWRLPVLAHAPSGSAGVGAVVSGSQRRQSTVPTVSVWTAAGHRIIHDTRRAHTARRLAMHRDHDAPWQRAPLCKGVTISRTRRPCRRVQWMDVPARTRHCGAAVPEVEQVWCHWPAGVVCPHPQDGHRRLLQPGGRYGTGLAGLGGTPQSLEQWCTASGSLTERGGPA
jgi:hypothetical protein